MSVKPPRFREEPAFKRFMKSLGRSLKGSLREVWSYTTGKAGLTLLAIFIFFAILALILLPPDYKYIWNQPKYWQDHPQLAPPEWVRALGYQNAKHEVYTYTKPVSIKSDSFTIYEYIARYKLDVYDYPQDIVVKLYGIKVPRMGSTTLPVLLRVHLKRPDGLELEVIDTTLYLPENATIAYVKEPLMLSVDRNLVVTQFSSMYLNKGIQANFITTAAVTYLFAKLSVDEEGNVRTTPLKGYYTVTLELYYPKVVNITNPASQVSIVVVGDCFGLMGTDDRGRDIAQALLYGFPVALAVGFVTAVASTLIGLFVGAISAYYGGLVDEFLQRLIDVMGNIPLLPFLILLVDITPVEYRLQVIMLVLTLFYWGGLAIVVRSMTLSIKEEPYVEAAKAIGASNARILLRHIIPQIVPYAVASLVFSVPGAILSEAGLSVLGLEHGWPTWGKVLAAARLAGRYDAWWWIIPPGLLLALTSLTFVLLGMAIETIVEPRLRTR